MCPYSRDNYPSKFVTIIVPQAPGGANDTVARIVAQKLSADLGQQFIVENRSGVGGNIGVAAAANAPKDGYTLLMAVGSTLTINPALYSKPGFDPIKSFERHSDEIRGYEEKRKQRAPWLFAR